VKNAAINFLVQHSHSVIFISLPVVPVLPVIFHIGPIDEIMMMSDPHHCWKPTTDRFLFACRAGVPGTVSTRVHRRRFRDSKQKHSLLLGVTGITSFFSFFVDIRSTDGRVWVEV